MASVEERYNNILRGAQATYNKTQSVNQRFNNIINNASSNKSPTTRAKRLVNTTIRNIPEYIRLAEEQRKKEEEEQQRLKSQQLKQQTLKINAISKNNNNQGINSSKLQTSNSSKFNTTTKAKAYTATNLAKDLNISVEDAQKRIDAQRQEEEKDVLAKWSKNIRNSAIGNSPAGKTVTEAIDTYNALGDGDLLNIVQNVESGITTGFANATSYLSNVGKKKNETLDNMGIGGKILAGLTGDFGYVFSNEKSRQKDYDTINNWATKLKKQENEKVQKNIESTNSKVTKKVAELSPSMGNNLVGAGISYVNPIAGTAYFTTSAGGSYYDDAKQRGMNDDQALLYGTVMGTMEGLTEQIPVNKMLGAGKNLGKKALKETLKDYGISMVENAVQEAVIEPISEVSALAIGGKETADFSNMGSRILKSGIDGALSSILLNGVNAGVSSAVKLQGDIESGKQVTQEQIKKVMQDIQESGKVNVEAIIKQEMQYQTQKVRGNVSNIEQNPTQTPNNIQNLQQNAVKNQSNVQQQQISRTDNKMSLNQNVERQNNYITSAQKYNINTNTQSVRKIGELANKRGINITYDDSLFKNNPKANAIYQTTTDKDGNVTRNIILNPNMNTNRTLEQIELHEIVHDMYGTEKFNKLKEMVLAYDKSKAGYQEARAELEQLYSQVYDKNSADFQSLIDEEAVADILGNRLGDQEFVNSLVNMKESRSIARKIYDWVVEKLNNMTRSFENINQYFYWKDVKNKFEEAFRQEYKGNNNSIMYSIETDSNGRKYIKVDTDQNIFEGIEPKDYTQIAKMYMQDYLKGETKLGEDATTRIGNKGISKYTNPKQQTKYINEKMQLTPELKNVLQIAEKVKSGLPTKDTSKYPSWEYYKFNFELGGKTFEGLINIGIDKNGNKHFYEINKIHTTSNSYVSTSKSSSTDFINNSVAQNEQNVNNDTTAQYSMQESENNSGSFNLPKNHKQHQLEIIKKHNPMNDDYHTGIRSIEDIKTLEETLKDSDWVDYDEFNPDLTKQDINKAIEAGKITVYSSYPIEQGVFVSPSKMEAETYSENGKVYSKEINIEDVAWIDPTQGQYARVENIKEETKLNLPKTDNQGRILTKEQQEYFKDSKVRDENGNLLEVYHGTDSDFNEFNIDYLGSKSGDLGFLGDGFYLATHKGEAGYYGQKVMSGYVNITNPFNIQELSYYNGQYMNGEDSNPFLKIKNLVDMNSEWSNIEINSTTYGKIADTVSSFLKDIKVEKAGDIVDSRNEVTGVMWNITVNGKTYQVESVPYYNKESMIADELNKNMRKKFGYLNSSEILQYITEEKRFNNGKSFSDVLKEKGYDGIVQGSPQTTDEIVIFNSNQFKNIDNTNPTDNPDIRYSTNSTNAWQQRLDTLYKNNNKGTKLQDVKLPTKENASTQKTSNMQEQQNINLPPQKNKTLNPTEIANLKQEDANTTVKLPQKESKQGNRVSNFFGNVTQDAQFLNEDLRKQISQDDGVIYYQGVTNEQTLNQAFKELQDGGSKATLEWFNQDSKKATAKDTAKGWILLKQYQDAGDYQSAVEVAKKMREIGTNAGQTVQAFNILSRLTPEGMVYYAQSELSEVYEAMVKNKSKDWIDKNASSFDLTPQETQFIMDTMEEVGKMEDGYDKKVKLAEIQKIITDKIPPTKGQSIKAWMRISMLFNPKTQVRNIAGNATILPVNMFSDLMSTAIDKAISKKTGVRTTGITNIAKYGKGFGKGLYESYNDFRKGINTRNIQGNRFEVKEGRSFKNKGLGKALNKVDNMLSFMLDAGDRGFYEATFTNSINNQLVLNKTTEVTQDMIDIATNEALQRTWQDNNEYTKAVLQIRKILNKFGTKSYGLGDVLIPFAKTPANLTKAIIDYSPVGLAKTITRDAMIFNRSLSNGQYSPQLQHKFVQNLGKGMAGTALYVLGYALAKAGIASGEPDDDKDVKNFMKNSLGISSYSIKIGDKSFTFDWAQPVATPIAIMTNYVKYSEDNPDAKAIEKALQSINIGTEQLLQQSFMESLNTVLNGNGTFVENLSQAVLDLPARAIPTFSKQIADMVDGTQRTTFEYKQPLQSAVNSVKAKIPGLSKTLPASVDTLGNEIQKYGGENNVFNVFFNPANVNKGELSKAGEEIYNIYQETGNTSVFPRTAPYYMNNDGEKINMTAETRAEFQKVSGKYVENSIEKLLNNKTYKNLSDTEKAEIIEEIISDSYNKAKYEVLDIENESYSKTRKLIEKVGVADYYDYTIKTSHIEGSGAEKKKIKVLAESKYSNKHKEAIYEAKMGSDDELYSIMKETGINITEYLNYKTQEFSADKKDDGTVDGKSISGSKKKKVYAYVNNMKITGNQRLLLLGTQYKLTNSERQALAQYVKSLNITNKEKLAIYDKLQGFTVYKDGRVTF